MAIVHCSECSKKLKVADTSIGKKVKCTCGAIFVAEVAAAAAPAAAVEKVLVACTECNAPLKVSAGSLGKRVKCPKCGEAFVAATAEAKPAAKPVAKAPAPPPPEPEFGFKDDEEEAPRSRGKRRDEEDDEAPKARSKPKTRKPDDEGDDKPSEPPAKPKSQLVLNLLVALLVLSYAGFFAAVFFKLIDLKLPYSGTGAFRPNTNKGGPNQPPPKIDDKKDDDKQVDPKKKDGEEINQPELIELPKKGDPIPPDGGQKKIEEKKVDGDVAAAMPGQRPVSFARIESRRATDFAPRNLGWEAAA